MNHYIFLRIAWMKHYKGVTIDDIPRGAGSYVDEYEDGGEVYNFYPNRGSYYGYARVSRGRSLDLAHFGADEQDEFIDDITIVLFARNPETGGQFIVGWYKKARLYRSVQSGNNKDYNFKTLVKNGTLVKHTNRIFPVEGPGQTNVWYPKYYKDSQFFKTLAAYINNPGSYKPKRKKRKKVSGGWQMDAEKRKKVEIAAMDAVAAYFEDRNYEVAYREKENLGWDLEAYLGNQTLLLEVKGLSNDFSCVDFTPNEYQKSKAKKNNYRICVLSNALSKNKKLDIFYWEKNGWISNENKSLKAQEIISARFHNQ